MKNSREFLELKSTLGAKVKSPKQMNALFEADCEIIKLGPKKFLATSIDSVCEEIDLGLYKEIETWAWIAAMSSVSDLAASGSTPIGMTLSSQWKYGTKPEFHKQFYKTFNSALKKAKVAFLGGDSGNAPAHSFTTSIIGESSSMPLMRTGIKEGDLLVLLHQKKTGLGPALAYRFLMNAPTEVLPESLYRPTPSWERAQELKSFSRAAIDTSDGIATSVYILAELNMLGVELIWDEKINHPKAMQAMADLKLHPLFLWLGDHGDFQTLLVIPEKNMSKLKLTKDMSVIGRFTKKKKENYNIVMNGKNIPLPIEKITVCSRDLESYSKLIKDMQSYLSSF